MGFWDASFLTNELSDRTSFFGLRIWVLIAIFVGIAIVVVLLLLSICLSFRRRRSCLPSSSSRKTLKHLFHDSNPPVSKEILEIFRFHSPPRTAVAPPIAEIQVEIGKENRQVLNSDQKPLTLPAADFSVKGIHGGLPEVSHLGWGHWYTLRELEEATGGFIDENVIGEGGYGIVYRGILPGNTMVAIKNLLNNRGQAEKEFRVEVEAIGRVRHKNLVRLLGYCVEGAYRMLVYEYVDNGNLDQWIHGDVGAASPLTWEIRTNIILGTAKG